MGALGTRLPRGLGPAGAPYQRRAIGSAGERLVHTEEVTGSIPVSPTHVSPGQRIHKQLSSYAEGGSCRRMGRNLEDRVLRLVAERRESRSGTGVRSGRSDRALDNCLIVIEQARQDAEPT